MTDQKFIGSIEVNVLDCEINTKSPVGAPQQYMILIDRESFEKAKIHESRIVKFRIPQLWIYVNSRGRVPKGRVMLHVVLVIHKDGTELTYYWYYARNETLIGPPPNESDVLELLIELTRINSELILDEMRVAKNKRRAQEIQTILHKKDEDDINKALLQLNTMIYN